MTYAEYGAAADADIAALTARLTAAHHDLDVASAEAEVCRHELAAAQTRIAALEALLAAAAPTFSPILVPSRGVLWGAAGAAFTKQDDAAKHREFEGKTGQPVPIAHSYVVGDSPLPSDASLTLAADGRTLLVNWKVAAGTTWAAVANGNKDARIDATAARLKLALRGRRFFLAVHHEPENDVATAAGSGMTPQDYRAMFRHTIARLRDQGVTGMISVYNPMAYYGWVTKAWFEDLYPGDDVVDWIGLDLYVQASSSKPRTLANMLNKQAGAAKYADGSVYQGAYAHHVRLHGNKPLMLAEWGYQRDTTLAGDQAAFYRDVAANLADYPQVKALVYFNDSVGSKPTDVANSPDALAAWQELVGSPMMVAPPAA